MDYSSILYEINENGIACITQLELESCAQLVAWSLKNFTEGTQAFFEKRFPRFN